MGIHIKTDADLIGTHHVLIKDLTGNFVNQRMSNPGTIMAVGNFSKFVCADLVHRGLIGFFVSLDGNLSGHPADGRDLASLYMS